MLSYLSYLLRCAQQSAGSIDILSTAGADGGEHTVLGQIVAELLHLLVAHSLQRDVGNLMEAYQVEAAVEPFTSLMMALACCMLSFSPLKTMYSNESRR